MAAFEALEVDLNESFTHLAKAPIVEAVIHWQARPQTQLEPDAFRQRLLGQLGDYSAPKQIRSMTVEAHVGADGADHTQHESWMGLRFESPDGRYIAQFRTDGFALSRLEPYETWEAFAAEARRLWTIYVNVAAPTTVQRLGVRFINRIAPVRIEEVGKVLTRPPVRLGSLGFPVRDFLYQSTHDVPGHPYRLKIIDTVQSEMLRQNEGPALILDIDAFTIRSIEGVGGHAMNEHMERLRWLKNKAFYSLIKKAALRRFKPEKR